MKVGDPAACSLNSYRALKLKLKGYARSKMHAGESCALIANKDGLFCLHVLLKMDGMALATQGLDVSVSACKDGCVTRSSRVRASPRLFEHSSSSLLPQGQDNKRSSAGMPRRCPKTEIDMVVLDA